MNECDIFMEALRLPTPAGRQAYVNEACGHDLPLRQRVEALLVVHERAERFFWSRPWPACDFSPRSTALPKKPGTLIGPYKLLEQIGEGGFRCRLHGRSKLEPVRRKVALKVIKPGMDSKQIIARFEAEPPGRLRADGPPEYRARLGRRQPPNSGRPYFVMELVKGMPITDFCDQSRLTAKQRLELFADVCPAVQHAHQKGIIHRDIKPSNVLVTLQDGEPLVKMIDFGIAKALGQQLTDKTLLTGFAQTIGTPLYMSPEQTALSNVDVDTCSDIYSLGVLLYELLTGTTPFEKERLHQANYDEMRRIIVEEEPPKPSTRLSQLWKKACSPRSRSSAALIRAS